MLARGKLVIEPGILLTGTVPGRRLDLACRTCGQLRSVTDDVVFSVIAGTGQATAA